MHSDNQCWQLVLSFFKGNTTKTAQWFETRNPLLGNLTPLEVLEFGREKRLLDFIYGQLRLNEAPPPQPTTEEE